jgi:hypothetical protein
MFIIGPPNFPIDHKPIIRSFKMAAIPPAPVDRSEYLQQFLDAGFVKNARQLNNMDEGEFQALLHALNCPPDPFPAAWEMPPAEVSEMLEPPQKTVEERIAALKVPKNAIDVMAELEAGRQAMMGNLVLYEAEVRSRIAESRVLRLL